MLHICGRLFCLLIGGVAVISVAEEQDVGAMKDWSRRPAFVDPLKNGGQVNEIWRGGHWNAESLSGEFLHLVVGNADKSEPNKLYIQWVVVGSEGEEVAYSISIDELNTMPKYSFGLPNCSSQSCDVFSLDVLDIFEGKSQKFKFTLEGLGQYRFHL